MGDMWLAVGLAVLAFIMAYLGAHMTVHPPATQRAKTQYKVGFIGLGVLSVVLIGIQAKRNADTQNQLTDTLENISERTKQPPQVTVNIPPAVPPIIQVLPQPTPVPQRSEGRTTRQPLQAGTASHPVISVTKTSISKDEAGKMTAVMVLENTGDSDAQVTTRLFLIVGDQAPQRITAPESLAFARGKSIELTYRLPMTAEGLALNKGGFLTIMIRATAEYKDGNGRTLYTFEGAVQPGTDHLDIKRSEWTRPS